ncbi:MBL fold metallo-hydrolase [Flavobacteriaceae bacterium M23B6Z8]
MFKNTFYAVFISLIWMLHGCNSEVSDKKVTAYLTVLGTIQDAGYPHINHPEEFEKTGEQQLVTSLGLVDAVHKKKWLFEATPDMPLQLHDLASNHLKSNVIIDGIFLTHAHIGHYTGLMYLGREAMGARQINVYAMPRMKSFLESNGPWDQLVKLQNIRLKSLKNEQAISLTNNLSVTPFTVPHRDEYSETVGYRIQGPSKTALFIPDIDKWSVWEKDLVTEIKNVDVAFLDATFLADGEISRPMEEVPHPFIEETVMLLKDQPQSIRDKVIFIHFNHSNPVIDPRNKQRKELEKQGYRFAQLGTVFPL